MFLKRLSAQLLTILSTVFVCALLAAAQSLGSAGTVNGIVADPNGAVVSGATVTIQNQNSGYQRTTTTGTAGDFHFNNVPFNPYHLLVTAPGFEPAHQDLTLRSSVPVDVKIPLTVAGVQSATVTVESGDNQVENTPVAHTDLDSSMIAKLPIGDPSSSGLSDAVTRGVGGVVSDSNGFFHPLGEHADTTISLDNQPISDQQSKIYSNTLPVDAIQSFEAISGIPPAEYGDKASLVVNAITKSGLGQKKPFGSITARYGSFGTVGEDATFGLGGARFGNFLTVSSERSGRFLDAPEFAVLHDRGNTEKIFDRIDYQLNQADILHLNLYVGRSRFQIPNTFDQQAAGQDQRQLIKSFNLAPGLVHTFNPSTLLTVNAFLRQDQVKYSPSANPFSDRPATISQQRRLTNAGFKADVSYVRGRHNAKAGLQFQHTFLTEGFSFGITDPTFVDPAQQPGLVPFDLTRGGRPFNFRGHTDIKEEAVYAQDSLTLGRLTLSPGLRYDRYDGLSHGQALQPRLGTSYLVKPTGTVLRAGYARIFETPYNENLVLSSTTGAGGLATNVFGAFGSTPLRPGRRNQFNLGFQQPVGTRVVVDGEYFWKYTDTEFDFDTLFNTPVVFPIEWRKSKIDGASVRVTLNNYKGFSVFFVAGHSRARLFGPEVGGLLFNSPVNQGVFRVDHDEAFEQTTNLRYQYKKDGPWVALTYRFESGLVAGSVPDLATALALTADQQAQIGLFCGSTFATLNQPLRSCTASSFGAVRLRIPPAGTENDDTNPPRIAPRHLFDLGVGFDNLFRTEHRRVTLRVTVINLTNRVALYNFLSTFSGTHFVTPRSIQAELGMVF